LTKREGESNEKRVVGRRRNFKKHQDINLGEGGNGGPL